MKMEFNYMPTGFYIVNYSKKEYFTNPFDETLRLRELTDPKHPASQMLIFLISNQWERDSIGIEDDNYSNCSPWVQKGWKNITEEAFNEMFSFPSNYSISSFELPDNIKQRLKDNLPPLE